MSSTQRLQDYIDSLKAARLSSSTGGGGGGLPPPSPENQNQNQNNSSPFHTEPRDYLELEFMDSLDQRMQQLEKNLATSSSSSSGQTLDQQRRNHLQQQRQYQHQNQNSPPPNDLYPNHTPRLTLAQKLQQQQHSLNRSRQLDEHSSSTSFSRFQPNNTSNNNASSLRSTFHSQFIPPTSLVFRVTLPFLRSTLTTTSNNNSECATFMVHVADLSQTGDDLLWHIIAQARIRFPDLMEVGGFEWTPGAASSLVLFALSADEANHWVETDQSKGGAARAGGAFLHYNAATPIHKYMPIARALRKREEQRAKSGNMSGMSTSISEAMTRNFQEVGPAVDVEIFVLLKSLVPQHELTTESLRKALV